MKLFFSFFFVGFILFSGASIGKASDSEDTFVIESYKCFDDQRILTSKKLIVDTPVPFEKIGSLKKCKNLTSISLTSNFSFDSIGAGERLREGFFRAIKNLDNLHSLDLSGQNFDSYYLRYIPKGVRYLNLDATPMLESALKFIPPSVQEVSLKNTFLGQKISSMTKVPHSAHFVLD